MEQVKFLVWLLNHSHHFVPSMTDGPNRHGFYRCYNETLNVKRSQSRKDQRGYLGMILRGEAKPILVVEISDLRSCGTLGEKFK